MRQQVIFNTYKQQFKKWLSYQSQYEINTYFSIFSTSIQNLYDCKVTYDINAYIVSSKLLKSPKYLHFDGRTKSNGLRKRWQMIIRCLEVKRFIGKRQISQLMDLVSSQQEWMKTKIIRFLTFNSIEGNRSKAYNWEKTVNMDISIFWQFIQKRRIRDPILDQLAIVIPRQKSMNQVSKKSPQRRIRKQQSIVYKNINTFQTQNSFSEIEKEFQRQQLFQKNQNYEPNIFDNQIIISPLYYDYYKEQVQISEDLSQLELSEQINQPQITENAKERQNAIQLYLKNAAYHQSLFYNQIHRITINSLQNFLNSARQYFFINNQYNLELFGSLRNTFALASEYDIDLTLLPRNSQKLPDRKGVVNHLFQIRRKIDLRHHSWIKSTRIYCFDKLPVPFLKIQVDPNQFQNCFRVANVTKIDITIGNKTAVINSQIMSHYSKIPQIHFFCLLVKYWAKARNVINFQEPMKGLSSYGVSLICMYYLMATKQISFIDFDERKTATIDIGTIIPNLQHCEIKSLKQNFRGFLQFYSEAGTFQKERRIACLIDKVKSQKCTFNDNFVINMYDFIDQSNPGRLVLEYKDRLFSQFERALTIVKSNNPQKIRRLFD